MYLEEILEDLKREIKEINRQVSIIKKKINSNTLPKYVFVSQLESLDFWPYSLNATRKMISRKRLIEGIHYQKLDGRIICNVNALKEFISQKFANYKWSVGNG